MRNPTPGIDSSPHLGGHGDGPSADLLGQMGYETRDVSLAALGRWLIVLIIFILGSTLGSLVIFKILIPNPSGAASGELVAHVRHLPPFPQLQTDPKKDMIDYRTAEDQVLTGKGSGSTKAGMSIDDAISAQAQKGISGVTGNATPWNYSSDVPEANDSDKSYPGGGDYGAASVPAKPTAGTGSAPMESAPANETEPASPTGGAPGPAMPAAATTAPATNGNGTTP